MATQKRAKQQSAFKLLLLKASVLCFIAASVSQLEASPSPSSSSSSAAASSSTSREKITVTGQTTTSSSSSKSTTSHPTTSGPTQSTQSVAAEAAAEAAAAALGGITSGLEQALSIVPASINLESISTTSTPAPTKIVIIESSGSTTSTTTTTTTASPTTKTTTTSSAPQTKHTAEQVVVTVHSNGTTDATVHHQHSGKRINTTDMLHKFDLFVDPVCEQLAKLTDKQLAKFLSQLKQINSLASNHDALAKCFNEHTFTFSSASNEVMNRVQLGEFCASRSANSDQFKQWSACSARNWSPSIDKELDRALKDRIEGARAKAKHLGTGGPKLNHVEMSLIDSIVAHLHDEQVQEIASELEHEQKKHEPQHQISVVAHSKPIVIGNSGKQSSTSSSLEMIPSGDGLAAAASHHDQIISASPFSSSSQQQQHHEILSNLSQQPQRGSESLAASLQGHATASTSNIQQETQNLNMHNQQQTSSNVAIAGSAAAEQQRGHETLISDPTQSQSPVLMTSQAQAEVKTSSQTSTVSTLQQDHTVAAAAAAAPVFYPPAQQESASTAVAGHQEAAQTTVQQQQPGIDQAQSPNRNHMNDLVTLAKLQTGQTVGQQQTTTTTTTNKETVQLISSSPTQTPAIPTISPVANFLLNSIDFATKTPKTMHPVALPVQPIAPAVSSFVAPNPVPAPIPAAISAPVAVPITAQVPIQPNGPSDEIIAAHEQLQIQQQQQTATVATASQDTIATAAAAATTTTNSAAGPPMPLQPVAEPAFVPYNQVAPQSPPIQPVVPVQPEILPVGQSAIIPAATAAAATSVVSAASQHTETTTTQSVLTPPIIQHPAQAQAQLQHPVAAAPLVEPAIIKNVNSALDALANANTSGIVTLPSSNGLNTTLFISSPNKQTTTTTPAPITILVKSEHQSTTSTTVKPTVVEISETKAPDERNNRKNKNKNKKSKRKKSHDEKLARLRSKFGSAQVHDVIVIGEHTDGDDTVEDYDDHSEHHHSSDEDKQHEHSDHHNESALILDHSSSSSSNKVVHEQSKSSSSSSLPRAEITTVVEINNDDSLVLDEHKDHEHLLAGLKSGDVVHMDAGEH